MAELEKLLGLEMFLQRLKEYPENVDSLKELDHYRLRVLLEDAGYDTIEEGDSGMFGGPHHYGARYVRENGDVRIFSEMDLLRHQKGFSWLRLEGQGEYIQFSQDVQEYLQKEGKRQTGIDKVLTRLAGAAIGYVLPTMVYMFKYMVDHHDDPSIIPATLAGSAIGFAVAARSIHQANKQADAAKQVFLDRYASEIVTGKEALIAAVKDF